ncbi:FAD/NAD(P)-binding domain-containing protein [Lojkania enalia]|uniref:FAD/NAD(P)-binding domain-containing protein n=1 Tax=Lojkania enalia TaxID=147567 RepID=A0A9P4N2A2_9PLEO|nr:FAD/NAD(P)-binding domain-containing protein [Didymosphaeria enalia]
MSGIPNLPEYTPLVETNGVTNGVTNGAVNGAKPSATPFQLYDQPIENFRKLKVIVVGAGYSGIYMGIRIPERLRNVELVIYEKNAGVGGAWWENRYLGCACDVPSHSYQFSFEPNLNWSSLYAPAREIQAYLEHTARKYSADRFIRLSHEVTECRWDDITAKWHVTVKNLTTGEVIHDEAEILITARGNLNNPAWPEIDGLKDFEGEVMHSAKWNEEYDFTNKRIGVIGSGSSSIQIVPSLQRLPGTRITTFVRSKTWISPPFSQQLWDKYGFSGFQIPPEIRQKFHDDPVYYHNFRLAVEEDGNGIHAITIKGTPIHGSAIEKFKEHMQKRLETHPHIFDALLPSFSPGCRRLTPGPGYLEALTQPNVSFITSPIIKISKNAVHTADNAVHELDTLVCATGFHTSAPPPFPITGANNLPLTKKWEDRATTYLSHSLSGFPNMFTLLGPNSAIGSGSLTMMIEAVGSYIVRCIRKIQRDNIRTMSVLLSRERDFTEYVDAYFARTVFSEDCNSWYKDRKSRKVVGLWPGSTLHCLEAMRSPRWEDFEYTYLGEEDLGGREGNRMAWLGNGWTEGGLESRDLAWYLYPEFMEKPVAPLPEKKGGYKIRPFAY